MPDSRRQGEVTLGAGRGRRSGRHALLALVLVLAPPQLLRAQTTLEVAGGTAFNLSTPLVVSQRGQPDIRIDARYSTRPYSDETYYYQVQIGRWRGNRGWLVGFIHHKLFLENPTPEVSYFALSHGYNHLYLSRAWRRGKLSASLGASAVITAPHSVVRGERWRSQGGFFGTGYWISGGGLQAAVQRKVPLGEGVFLGLEVKAIGGYARVPVVDGHATAPNLALLLHGSFGVEL